MTKEKRRAFGLKDDSGLGKSKYDFVVFLFYLQCGVDICCYFKPYLIEIK